MKCCITGDVMTDPVCDPDGNSYEREAIMEWLIQSATSPVTRAPLTPEQLIPNRALRELIEQSMGVPTATATTTATREDRRRMMDETVAASEEKRLKTAEEARERLSGADNPRIDASVQLELALERQELGEANVMLTAMPPVGTVRTPTDICMVIDTSGSMGGAASTGPESDGLSLLDVVKHAVKTVRRNSL
jgi:hypothetical protein